MIDPEIEPEEVVFVQWPTVAIENSAREIERLKGIICRTAELLEEATVLPLNDAAMRLYRMGASQLSNAVIDARHAIFAARDVLAELDEPPTAEEGDDGD